MHFAVYLRPVDPGAKWDLMARAVQDSILVVYVQVPRLRGHEQDPAGPAVIKYSEIGNLGMISAAVVSDHGNRFRSLCTSI
jgi:hypothetical protein